MPALELPIYQVDAFATRPFEGNPAAVCPLPRWLPDSTLQAIAAENNLSETAFFVGSGALRELRWFTPTTEVDLCGHATLASAFILCTELEPMREEIRFSTRCGRLTVAREGDRFVLDLPARPVEPVPAALGRAVADALGTEPRDVLRGQKVVALMEDAAAVRAVKPAMDRVAQLDGDGLIVTARGEGETDFVSRYFAPHLGVPEDPVTGSAHCELTPLWSAWIGRTELLARQLSSRGGELRCRLRGDRVHLAGTAVLYLAGTIRLPA